ncbi:MAG TPA: GvpL/GvpF family gas vesicle protein [Vicinamibacterales bacterium]|nr:GvpL/GvpF family gas vesicle protein [Vicinamibacterales bacterium]
MDNESVYVFAFTNGAAPTLRHARRRIEFIEVAGVHAAIERVTQRPAVTENELRAQHDIVMKIAGSVNAILPVRFGAIVDVPALETLVSMRRDSIRGALERVSGRVQMTVRVFEAGAAAVARIEPAAKPASGADYLEQRRSRSSALPAGDAAAVSRAIRDLVADERSERGQRHLQWTLYHLVDRSALRQYEQAIAAFVSPTLAVSGPWPPFAFVPDLWP